MMTISIVFLSLYLISLTSLFPSYWSLLSRSVIIIEKFGNLKTGIFGYSYELFCLIFCVVAMFAPGTAFKPYAILSPNSNSSSSSFIVIPHNDSLPVYNNTFEENSYSSTKSPDVTKDYTSVCLLLVGVIASRFGLWLADLTVTQILLEEVLETERGGINGVQYSLNQSFSLLRSALLVILPTMATFGYLVILSFLFIATACILFCVHACKWKKIAKQLQQSIDLDNEEKPDEEMRH